MTAIETVAVAEPAATEVEMTVATVEVKVADMTPEFFTAISEGDNTGVEYEVCTTEARRTEGSGHMRHFAADIKQMLQYAADGEGAISFKVGEMIKAKGAKITHEFIGWLAAAGFTIAPDSENPEFTVFGWNW